MTAPPRPRYNRAEFDERHARGETLDQPEFYVYRYYNDNAPAGHELVYVGYTDNFWRRDRQHSKPLMNEWYREQTRVEIEVFDNEGVAREAEVQAIRTECPYFNSQYVDGEAWNAKHGEYHDARMKAEWDQEMAQRIVAAVEGLDF